MDAQHKVSPNEGRVLNVHPRVDAILLYSSDPVAVRLCCPCLHSFIRRGLRYRWEENLSAGQSRPRRTSFNLWYTPSAVVQTLVAGRVYFTSALPVYCALDSTCKFNGSVR